jgi:hypothetical protein
MLVEHRTFRVGQGWDAPLPAMDSPQTLVLAFAAPELGADAAVWDELAACYPTAACLGCSSAGEIAGAEVLDASLSLAVMRLEHGGLHRAITPVADAADSFDAGARLAAQLPRAGLRAVFLLSDGLQVNGSTLVAGLARHLPPGVPVSGGLAADGSRFGSTWVWTGAAGQAAPAGGQVCAVGLYGETLQVGHGCDGGWQGFGPERRITRAEGAVLYELDGKPALQLYKTYLGTKAQDLPGSALLFPLSVRSGEENAATVVRTVLAVDETTQSMTFAGDLPVDGVARLMRAHGEQLIESAGRAAAQACAAVTGDGRAALMVSVSCVGRRLLLGERTEEEVDAVLDVAPAGVVHVGLYSYGEISPRAAGGASSLHNQTMTVTLISEDAVA